MTESDTISERLANNPPLPVADEVKKRVDALEVARAAAYKSFSDRREYEWKMCIGIWTFLAVFVSALVIGKELFNVTGAPLFWGTAMICTLTFFLHVFWTVGISRSNAIDLGVTYHYAGKIQEALGITFPCELNTEIDSAKKNGAAESHDGHISPRFYLPRR